MQNSKNKGLTREEFKEAVFKRDGNKCVCCEKPAVDAHHLIERRLFPDGGYVTSNGVSLCESHHIKAEMTDLGCDELRMKAGIIWVVLPPGFDPNKKYSKWGDIILENGRRIPGPLFNDPGFRKICKHVLYLYEVGE